MSDAARETLKTVIAEQPDHATGDVSQLESLLRDRCGSQRREIALIGAAAREGVPASLRALAPGATIEPLVKRLQDTRGISADAARYAIDAWVYALDLPAAGPATQQPKPSKKAAGSNAGGVIAFILIMVARSADADPTLKAIVAIVSFLALGFFVLYLLWSLTNWAMKRWTRQAPGAR